MYISLQQAYPAIKLTKRQHAVYTCRLTYYYYRKHAKKCANIIGGL